MKHIPAHPGLTPQPFDFREVDDAWSELIRRKVGPGKVERAVHGKRPPLGYYRLTRAADGFRLFAKVVVAQDSGPQTMAARLAGSAARAGLPALELAADPSPLDTEYWLFLWPWIDGRFAAGTSVEMASLGRQLARLHIFLKEGFPQAVSGMAERWASRWARLEALSGSPALPATAAEALENFLARRLAATAGLTADAQALHDDLHPGNVLFSERGETLAFLDFDEALQSVGSPWLDISWVLERFCVTRGAGQAAELGRAFLSAYFAGNPSVRPVVPAEALVDAALWRNFRALALLDSCGDPSSAAWRLEAGKFHRGVEQVARIPCFLESIGLPTG